MLKILNCNKSCIPVLETYPVYNSKILCCFSIGINKQIRQIPQKFLRYTNILNFLVNYRRNSANFLSKVYCFVSGFRKEVTEEFIGQLQNSEVNPNKISFIQVSRLDLLRFVTMRVEYFKKNYKFSYTPSRMLSQAVQDQSESIFKNLVFFMQKSENSEVLVMEIEFFEDINHTLSLSMLNLCYVVPKEFFKSFHKSRIPMLVPTPQIENNFNLDLQASPRQSQNKPKIKIPIRYLSSQNSSSGSDESQSIERPIIHINRQNAYKNNKNFIELLSKTRLIQTDPQKKFQITDEEYEREYKKIGEVLNGEKLLFREGKSLSPNLKIPLNTSNYSPYSARQRPYLKSIRNFRSTPILQLRLKDKKLK